MTKLQVQKMLEWGLVLFVVVASFGVWLQVRFDIRSFEMLSDGVARLTIYTLFPLLGLLAFGLMWTHFVTGATRRLLGSRARRSLYWKVSSGLVLALIVLHPSMLNIGLIRDGFGLPPASYAAAYGALAIWLFVGAVSLLVFLSFELRRWFRKKIWWRYIEWAQVIAMVAIFFHALMLGRELSVPWFRGVWIMMGVLLIVSVVYTWYKDSKQVNRETR